MYEALTPLKFSLKGKKMANDNHLLSVTCYNVTMLNLAFIWLTKGLRPKRDAFYDFKGKKLTGEAQMFVVEGIEKVRRVIEENCKRKLTKHKKPSNNTIIEIDNCSPLEIVKLQKNPLEIAAGEGIGFVHGKGKRPQQLFQDRP